MQCIAYRADLLLIVHEILQQLVVLGDDGSEQKLRVSAH